MSNQPTQNSVRKINEEIIEKLKDEIKTRQVKINKDYNINEIQKELFGSNVKFGLNKSNNTSVNNIQLKARNNTTFESITVNNLRTNNMYKINTQGNYNDNLFKEVLSILEQNKIPTNIFSEVLDTHLNIIKKLQENLKNINIINNNRTIKIPINIKNLYRKYLDYIQKVVIIKVWKDLQILKLFGFVFNFIIPGIKTNIKNFKTKTINLNDKLKVELGDITTKDNDKIKGYIEKIKTNIDKCLNKIFEKIKEFLQDKNLQRNQQGGAKVEYAIFTDMGDLIMHINNLRTHKDKFEKALKENIDQFDDLCNLFIKLLDDIELEITEVIEKITPYIDIIGLEVDAENLLSENRRLIESLKNYINRKPNSQQNLPKPPKQNNPAQFPPLSAAQPAATQGIQVINKSKSNSISNTRFSMVPAATKTINARNTNTGRKTNPTTGFTMIPV